MWAREPVVENQKGRRSSGGLRATLPGWLDQPGGAPEGRWLAYGLAVNRQSVDMPAAAITGTRDEASAAWHGCTVHVSVNMAAPGRPGDSGLHTVAKIWTAVNRIKATGHQAVILGVMADPGASIIEPRPRAGRLFTTHRRVRLADVGPDGCCRLDALVRYAQDIARDDTADSGLGDPMNWVVRRTMIEVEVEPTFQEWVELNTWCSGYGGRWAERRTEIRGEQGSVVEAVTLWVRVDGQTGRPVRLSDDFFDLYGEACDGRKVSARTSLPSRPPEGASSRRWELRFTDLDVLGHVNNAAHWSAVEETLHSMDLPRRGVRAELEHAGAIERGEEAILSWVLREGGVDLWLMAGESPGNSVRVRPLR